LNTETVLNVQPVLRKSYSSYDVAVVKSLSTVENVEINKEILSPDTYLSKYISLNELGKRPDTTVVSISKTTFCEGDSARVEINDATSIRWRKDQQYIAGSGTSLTIKSSGTYRAVIKTIEGFEDSTRAIVINVTPIPTAPLVENIAYCVGATTATLSATASNNSNLLWYGMASSGGTATNSSIIPSATTIGQTDYYVSQKTIVNACEGPRAKITVTVNAIPAAPIVANVSYCIGATSSTLSATTLNGNTLNWFLSDTTSVKQTAAPTPDTKVVGNQFYYASQKNNVTGCESPRAKLIATIHPIPAKPAISRLEDNRLTSNIVGSIWYMDSLLIADTSTIIKPTVSGRYFVKSSQNGCVGSLSEPYYFLITDLYNISADEFIKFNPNPFSGQIKFDFLLKGINQINIELIQFGTGLKLFMKSNINSGTAVSIPNLPSGVYLLSVSSTNNKFVKQFKIVKI
jgi:hypothetical protein